ncbi:hypothetical protein PR048_011786 [Dryococelus australis]|uniref:Apple domain-containing protein n=1 Tax=Dryococelus australis TaxID=614101 RepID=A0ABQ9HML8_9NEOP|nr:hypothetical protein PR048_011786 [Dryococelus australis]
MLHNGSTCSKILHVPHNRSTCSTIAPNAPQVSTCLIIDPPAPHVLQSLKLLYMVHNRSTFSTCSTIAPPAPHASQSIQLLYMLYNRSAWSTIAPRAPQLLHMRRINVTIDSYRLTPSAGVRDRLLQTVSCMHVMSQCLHVIGQLQSHGLTADPDPVYLFGIPYAYKTHMAATALPSRSDPPKSFRWIEKCLSAAGFRMSDARCYLRCGRGDAGQCEDGLFTFEKVTGYFLRTAQQVGLAMAASPGITLECGARCLEAGSDCPAFILDYNAMKCFKLDRNTQGRGSELSPREGQSYFEKICLRGWYRSSESQWWRVQRSAIRVSSPSLSSGMYPRRKARCFWPEVLFGVHPFPTPSHTIVAPPLFHSTLMEATCIPYAFVICHELSTMTTEAGYLNINTGTRDIWGLCITGALMILSAGLSSDKVPPERVVKGKGEFRFAAGGLRSHSQSLARHPLKGECRVEAGELSRSQSSVRHMSPHPTYWNEAPAKHITLMQRTFDQPSVRGISWEERQYSLYPRKAPSSTEVRNTPFAYPRHKLSCSSNARMGSQLTDNSISLSISISLYLSLSTTTLIGFFGSGALPRFVLRRHETTTAISDEDYIIFNTMTLNDLKTKSRKKICEEAEASRDDPTSTQLLYVIVPACFLPGRTSIWVFSECSNSKKMNREYLELSLTSTATEPRPCIITNWLLLSVGVNFSISRNRNLSINLTTHTDSHTHTNLNLNLNPNPNLSLNPNPSIIFSNRHCHRRHHRPRRRHKQGHKGCAASKWVISGIPDTFGAAGKSPLLHLKLHCAIRDITLLLLAGGSSSDLSSGSSAFDCIGESSVSLSFAVWITAMAPSCLGSRALGLLQLHLQNRHHCSIIRGEDGDISRTGTSDQFVTVRKIFKVVQSFCKGKRTEIEQLQQMLQLVVPTFPTHNRAWQIIGQCWVLEQKMNKWSTSSLVDGSYCVRVCVCTGNVRGCEGSAWAFERRPGKELRGHDDLKLQLVQSRRDCIEACLKERRFNCRSAEYDTQTAECRLSTEDRRSRPNDYVDAPPTLEYLENQCLPGKLAAHPLSLTIRKTKRRVGDPRYNQFAVVSWFLSLLVQFNSIAFKAFLFKLNLHET